MTTATADANHRAWLTGLLHRAADDFAVVIAGQPIFGWNDRSIGSHATDDDGSYWLRLVTEHQAWASGDFWTGNVDATTITGITKPQVIKVADHDDPPHRVRAELMTLVPGLPCSPTQELRHALDLSAAWWTGLRRSLDRICEVTTTRSAVTQDDVSRRFSIFWGDQVDPTITRWTTAHADLHWANLHHPQFAIVDWELWGTAPASYDAATLYCTSLLVPDTSRHVHAALSPILDTPDGIKAQLYVIARLLLRVDRGDFADLAVPLHRHAEHLLRARQA